MQTVAVPFLITEVPAAVAVLDKNLCFINHSKIWLSEFNILDKNIIGKSYYNVFPETPTELIKIHQECLTGKKSSSTGQKFILTNGEIQWLKWRIHPWKNDVNQISGIIITMEDITSQKYEEELLLKAESIARIGGWSVDLVTKKIYWSKITKEIYDVTPEYDPNLKEVINFTKASSHGKKILHLINTAINEGTAWDTELQIITAKGTELWVRVMGEGEIINNKCVRLYGTIQDIDTKKRTALQYQEINKRLQIATSGANVGIWDYNLVENSLIWDDNMYSLYGIRKEDFKGEYEAWQAGLHPDDKKRGDEEITSAINGEKEFDTEFRVIWPNGEIRHIRAIAVTQRDHTGKAIKMIGTNWDITELKNTKLQLLKTEESLQGTFESSSIGMVFVGMDGKWTKANNSFCNSLGYSKEEIINLSFQDITHPDDLNEDLALLNELIAGKRNSYQLEKRYRHKNGYDVHVMLTKTVVKNINGEISHFIAQIVDLSLRIKAEKKLTKLLNISGEQNESLMNFAHIVSHNLRSHSSNLSMLAGFLEQEKQEDERQRLIGMLKEASSSLNETVLHLNEVVQVKASAHENMKGVNLYNAITTVQKNISLLLQKKEATCIINVPKNQKISAIPAYVDSILLNLFTNSLKYSAPDRPPIIEITSNIAKDKISVTFKDNGLGIDLKRHGEKIFGMFKTFHKHKEAKGIGLFITKNQIEAMNGSIKVESLVNKGTTFVLNFDKH